MALQSSGAISIGDIRTELGSSSGSLRTLSAAAGKSTPDAMSEFYGYSNAVAPSVTTNAISSITSSSMTLNGNVTSDGGGTITERGFYFGTNSSSPTNNAKYTVSGTTGTYSFNKTGLSGSTTYYCWAYATNSGGTSYGAMQSAATAFAVATASFSSIRNASYSSGSYMQWYNYALSSYATSTFYSGYIHPTSSALVQLSSWTGQQNQAWYFDGSVYPNVNATVPTNATAVWYGDPWASGGFHGFGGMDTRMDLTSGNKTFNTSYTAGVPSGNFYIVSNTSTYQQVEHWGTSAAYGPTLQNRYRLN